MKTSTVREFRDRATTLLKAAEPIVITRRGKIVGFFLPATGSTLPLEIRRDLFYSLTDELRRLMRRKGFREDTLVAEFDQARKARR